MGGEFTYPKIGTIGFDPQPYGHHRATLDLQDSQIKLRLKSIDGAVAIASDRRAENAFVDPRRVNTSRLRNLLPGGSKESVLVA